MRLSLYARISLKDKPPGYRGITGEDLVIGKTAEANMAETMLALLDRLADYYTLFSTAEQLNEQLDRIAEFCQEMRFQECEP